MSLAAGWAVALLALSAGSLGPAGEDAIEGLEAPDFTVTPVDMAPWTLSEHRGQRAMRSHQAPDSASFS